VSKVRKDSVQKLPPIQVRKKTTKKTSSSKSIDAIKNEIKKIKLYQLIYICKVFANEKQLGENIPFRTEEKKTVYL
jgi:hypothetical protein